MILSPSNCSEKMSPYGKGNIESEGTEKAYGAQSGGGGETGGVGGVRDARAVATPCEATFSWLSAQWRRGAGPWEQGQKAATCPGGTGEAESGRTGRDRLFGMQYAALHRASGGARRDHAEPVYGASHSEYRRSQEPQEAPSTQ